MTSALFRELLANLRHECLSSQRRATTTLSVARARAGQHGFVTQSSSRDECLPVHTLIVVLHGFVTQANGEIIAPQPATRNTTYPFWTRLPLPERNLE
eukprot:1049412-Pleurochrysis_carterae.AAC.2